MIIDFYNGNYVLKENSSKSNIVAYVQMDGKIYDEIQLNNEIKKCDAVITLCKKYNIHKLVLSTFEIDMLNDLCILIKNYQVNIKLIIKNFLICNEKLIKLLIENNEIFELHIPIYHLTSLYNKILFKNDVNIDDILNVVLFAKKNNIVCEYNFMYESFDPSFKSKIRYLLLDKTIKTNIPLNLTINDSNYKLIDYLILQSIFENKQELLSNIDSRLNMYIQNAIKYYKKIFDKQSVLKLHDVYDFIKKSFIIEKYSYTDPYINSSNPLTYHFSPKKIKWTTHEDIIKSILCSKYIFRENKYNSLEQHISLKNVYLVDQIPTHPYISYYKDAYNNGIPLFVLGNKSYIDSGNNIICGLISKSTNKYLFNSLPVYISKQSDIYTKLMKNHIVYLSSVDLNICDKYDYYSINMNNIEVKIPYFNIQVHSGQCEENIYDDIFISKNNYKFNIKNNEYIYYKYELSHYPSNINLSPMITMLIHDAQNIEKF